MTVWDMGNDSVGMASHPFDRLVSLFTCVHDNFADWSLNDTTHLNQNISLCGEEKSSSNAKVVDRVRAPMEGTEHVQRPLTFS